MAEEKTTEYGTMNNCLRIVDSYFFILKERRIKSMEDKLTVVKVEPRKVPEVVMIGSSLEELQKAVDGHIEVVYPYEDQVGLLMNEEGKLRGMELNRALRDENGQIYDIIAGTFFVVGLGEDDFCSLTDEQIKTYLNKFDEPYLYVRMGNSFKEIPVRIISINDKKKVEQIIKNESMIDR